MDLPSCRYRREDKGGSVCTLVKELVAVDDALATTNEATCRECSGFFEPSPTDWNPIVASLVRNAALCIGDERTAERAFQSLWHSSQDAYVSFDGRPHRNIQCLPLCERHRGAAEKVNCGRSNPCVHFVRKAGQFVGDGGHRSGWPFAMEAITSLGCRAGILFDDFVEQRYCYRLGSPGYQEPWVGVFHHPPEGDPNFLSQRYSLPSMLRSRIWQETEPYLCGAIVLSDHLRKYLDSQLDVPVVSIKHPGANDVTQWSPASFLSNQNKQLVQLGWFGRNPEAIFQITPHPDFHYVRVLPSGEHFEQYATRAQAFNKARGLRRNRNPSVVDRTYLSKFEISQLHRQNVVFTEMLAASANNVVIDCIASCTPLLVNRHPAVMEYLGPDYPLYYDDLSSADGLLDADTLNKAHRYLKHMDKSWLSRASFRASVVDALAQFSP